jgi:hypothetical protein
MYVDCKYKLLKYGNVQNCRQCNELDRIDLLLQGHGYKIDSSCLNIVSNVCEFIKCYGDTFFYLIRFLYSFAYYARILYFYFPIYSFSR